MTEYELMLLRDLNGEEVQLQWGAAMGEAIESLHASGHVKRSLDPDGTVRYSLTESGERAAVAARHQ